MNRQKNFIFINLILIFFLLSLIISFYFSIDAILNWEFVKNDSIIQTFATTDANSGLLNISAIDWWIGVMSVLFGSMLLFIIFWIVIISLRIKDKKRLFYQDRQNYVENQHNYNDHNYGDQINNFQPYIRHDTYILSESNYHNNVSYRTKEFVPYSRTLYDDYLVNNWWMRAS